MRYFAVFLKMKDTEKSQRYRQEHLDYIAMMRRKGKVFLFGRLADDAGGLVIYQGENLEEVKSYAEADPYIKLGARELYIREWAMDTDYTFTKSGE